MKLLMTLALFAVSSVAFATGPVQGDKTENGKGPLQDHTCQGGHNCNSYGHGTDTGKPDSIKVDIEVDARASAEASARASSSSSANSTNVNQNSNVAYGGAGGQGGDGGTASAVAFGGEGGNASASGGNAEQSQGQNQIQSQGISNSGNSANYNTQSNSGNNASQSTNINFESTGRARHYNKYGNNVSAYAPAIYSSSACTAGGLSAGISGFGGGVALGGAKQDPQCQVRENARILASLDADLALMYLCANPTVDVGAVLGTACKPAEKPVDITPEPEKPEPAKPEIPVVDVKVKG